MKNQRRPSFDSLSQEDKPLLSIYMNEYNDIFFSILITPSGEFLENLIKRVDLTVNKKFNGFSSLTRAKVENYFCGQIYSKEYKLANSAFKALNHKKDTGKPLKEFDGLLIEHCSNETKHKGKYIHTCGEPFYTFKFNNSILNNGQSKEIFLICLKCEMIYKSSLVKVQCGKCSNEFYTKVLSKDEENKTELPLSTWKKYHCNAIINDTMKCPDCHSNFLFDQEKNKLICNKCDKITDPKNIMWKCALCQKEFESEVKAYNPLEFKNMKISVKDTLLKRKKAKPEKLTCGCDYDISKTKFYHKSNCRGELLVGEMNKKKIIVCAKCDALSYYDSYVWTCPICEQKFKVGAMIGSSGLKNHLIKYDSSKKLMKEDDESSKKKHLVTSIKKNKNMVIPTPHKTGLKRVDSSRSPYLLLKQNLARQFSGIEIEDSIKNLSKMFAKCADEKPLEKLLENKKMVNNSNSNSSSLSTTANEEKQRTISEIIVDNKEIKNTFEVNEYLIKKQIGEGSFGKIYLVESKSKKQFALKKIVATSLKEIESLKHEYEILLSLQQCESKMNLVTIHGIQTKQLDPTTYVMYVLMDLATTDWEKEILARQKRKLYYTEKELLEIIHSLISTFAELQRKNISHRDIKPQNILIFQENSMFRIADFGEAKEIFGNKGNTNKQTLRGTELYMSPILFHALRSSACSLKYIEHNTYKSDVFSFGLCCLFAATLCFESLYDIRELTVSSQVRKVIERYLKRCYSVRVIEIMCMMLEVNEKLRCDFIEMEKKIENIMN